MKFDFKILLFSIVVVFVSCKNESKKADSTASETSVAPVADPMAKPEITAWAAAVSKLNLRETPEATGKVAASLEKGALLLSTGKRSDKKVAMKLRDIDEEGYFYEVTTTDGKTGWVYGPAMTKIYVGSKAGFQNMAELNAFGIALGKLPTNAVESGGKAYDLLKTMLPKGGDAAFVLVEKMLRDLSFDPKISASLEAPAALKKLESEGDKIWKNEFDPMKYPETKRLAENGFRVSTAEGSYFPTVDYAKLKAVFAQNLTPATAAWLNQSLEESLHPTSEDGGILLEPNELVDRALVWENWAKQNPYHVFTDDAKISAFWLASSVLVGDNNTPQFDYETKKLTESGQKAWDFTLKTYPNSDLAAKIKEMQALVAADGGLRGPKTEAWIEARMKNVPAAD